MKRPPITPGPWHQGINEGEVFNPDCRKRIVDNTKIRTECSRVDYPNEERKANAQAIAALPDLLSALEELLSLEVARNMHKAKAAMIKAGYTF